MTVTTPETTFAHLSTDDLAHVLRSYTRALIFGRTDRGHVLTEGEEYTASVMVGRMRVELRERRNDP